MKLLLSTLIALTTFLSTCLNADNDRQEIAVDTNTKMADIVSVSTSKRGNTYNFSVGISSPDIDCSQYANWWEIITEDGALLYRRILGHSHANEQPFVRSGGNLQITENQVLIIRAHMNTSGYGTQAFKGSIKDGFKPYTIGKDFAQNLASQTPLPSNCAF